MHSTHLVEHVLLSGILLLVMATCFADIIYDNLCYSASVYIRTKARV